MQVDVSNALSDLKTFSDSADQIIFESNLGNDSATQWCLQIKEIGLAIANGTYCNASTSSEKSSSFCREDLPSLVDLVKGKQNSRRVSALLSNIQKDNRARLSHRKSRKSLRKIILGKSRSNQWKISNRKSSVKSTKHIDEEEDKTTPVPKDRLLEFDIKGEVDVSTNKGQHSKSYFEDLDVTPKKPPKIECYTPILKTTSNIDQSAPLTRSKLQTSVKNTTVVKTKKKSISFSSQNSYISIESNDSEVIEPDTPENNTPDNKTIIIDSDSSSEKSTYITPITRAKRKSSAQHSQENAKKIKSSTSEVVSGKQNKNKREDNIINSHAFKKIKLSKDVNAVIPTKIVNQQNQIQPEKRILKEIQKKEEKVNENAKKLQSLQKMKIEENKKAREKKMEKAMQQRKKIEKEKEERIRSRTQSKQENLQQTDSVPKKGAQKKVESSYKSSQRSLRSTNKTNKVSNDEQKSPKSNKKVMEVNKTYIHEPSPQEITNTNAMKNVNVTYVQSPAEIESNTSSLTKNDKAPPKPNRNAKNPSKILSKNNTDSDTKEYASSKVQPSTSNSDSSHQVREEYNLTSTPAIKKVKPKITLAQTPINAKKPTSYAMTPHEQSFVNYDISEIKSDDSDDDESTSHKKPIPSWASGMNLRTALLKQHYTPIDVDELFGNYFLPPKLEQIMGMEKKHYHKRTSSAIWLESPNRSRSYYP